MRYFAEDPSVKVIVVYLEGVRNTKAFRDACKAARAASKPVIALKLDRNGSRSTFGELRVLKPGVKDPVAISRAVAVYTELNEREVTVPVSEAFKGQLSGPVTVEYLETYDDGTKTIAETHAVLR
jgi:hypothetical protein